MDNKEFSKQLEERTKRFAIEIIKLSSLLPETPEGKVINIRLLNLEPVLVLITGRRIVQGVRQILRIKLKYVRVKQVKRFIG